MAKFVRMWRVCLLVGVANLYTGCATIHLVVGYEDRSEIRGLQNRLSCGMSVAEIEATAGLKVHTFSGPDKNGVTHAIQRNFASLSLIMRQGKLDASRFLAVDNLKSVRLEREVKHCNG